MTILFLSCKPKKQDIFFSFSDCGFQKDTGLTVTVIYSLGFHRSFSAYASIKDPSEAKRYLNARQRSNPVLVSDKRYPKSDTVLFARLQQLQLVKRNKDGHYELPASLFKPRRKAPVTLHDPSGKRINVIFNMTKHPEAAATVTSEDSCVIGYYPPVLAYQVADIIPGGNKEIVLLNQSFMTDNMLFDLQVYEIKYK